MPTLLVFAGPNGSGKSTITSGVRILGEYVNADNIQKELSCSSLEAAIIAEATREELLNRHLDFTFETVLSTERNIDLMIRAKKQDYTVVCIYVLTVNPMINIERVKNRVSNGGHNVPEEKVISRYSKALKLLPTLFPICDELYVFDNSNDSSKGNSSLIIRSVSGSVKIYPSEIWSEEMINSLVFGIYPDEYIKL